MAAHESSEQHSLRIGDTVLLYAKEVLGYVFSEVSRYFSANSSRSRCGKLMLYRSTPAARC